VRDVLNEVSSFARDRTGEPGFTGARLWPPAWSRRPEQLDVDYWLRA
jgi:hypothetical protein